MDLITPVSQAIGMFAGIVSIGVALMFFGVALARWSVDFFKGGS